VAPPPGTMLAMTATRRTALLRPRRCLGGGGVCRTLGSGAGAEVGAPGSGQVGAAHWQHKLVNGTKLAKTIREQVSRDVAALRQEGWVPRLVSLVFSGSGDASAIAWYVRNQRRVAELCGIEFEERCVPGDIGTAALVAELERANKDPRVTGVVMQRPFPAHLAPSDVQMAIHPLKDVEGMHPSSIGNVVYGEAELAPCTALAAVKCLKASPLARGPSRSLHGLACVVVGHSEIVGKPVSFMLMSEGAVVTTCHHMTRDVATHTRKADAVFVAVGKPGLIRGDMLKPGGILIDIGINAAKDPLTGEETVVGDADLASCLPVVGWITPVPGGVGPVTTAVLMENTVKAARAQKRHYEGVFGPAHRASNTYMLQ
jgi:methylenetetrahydrofolate dehydrogenase (NADP+)/methenyltetrahydrofolate cyclohydrolase